MAIQVVSEVWRCSQARGQRLLVLLALADRARAEDGLCWPGVRRVAEQARVSLRTAQRAIEWLVQHGEVERVVRQGGRGHRLAFRVTVGHYAEKKGVTVTPFSGMRRTKKGVRADTLSRKKDVTGDTLSAKKGVTGDMENRQYIYPSGDNPSSLGIDSPVGESIPGPVPNLTTPLTSGEPPEAPMITQDSSIASQGASDPPPARGETDAKEAAPKFDLAPYLEAWKQHFGAYPPNPGMFGKFLKPVVEQCGHQVTLKRWQNYLTGWKLNPKYFGTPAAAVQRFCATPSAYDDEWWFLSPAERREVASLWPERFGNWL